MSNVTSTLDIVLKDDVTKSAAQVAVALEKMAAKERQVADALAKTNLQERFQGQIKALGASVPHVEAAARSWADFAKAQGLAANSTEWTKAQIGAVKNWERVTKAGLKAVMGEEKTLINRRNKMIAQMDRRQPHGGGLLGGVGALVVEHGLMHAASSMLERYQEFDNQRRYAKAVMGLSDKEQEPLVQQALHGGATSRFNDIQWLEGQREFAARGYKTDQVMAFTQVAATIGQAMDQSLPESVKAIEGAMLGFGKDTSTYAKAVAAAGRTADLEVKASKVSGMTFDDIVQLYKYAAAPAKMAGLTEEQMLAFGGVAKKANMGGDESGVAFRALAKALVSPTAGAITAMRANGIDFSSYQSVKPMDTAGFTAMVAQRYGVQLSASVQAGIGQIFSDKGLVGDASTFTPTVVRFLQGALGGKDAKSLKSIAGLAKEYRTASVGGVDTVRLLTDMMTAMSKNKGLANAVFGLKQGGRVFAALGDPKIFNEILDQIENHSQGFARNVADQRNAGFDGAVKQLQGAIATLGSSLGRSLDGGGSGGLLSDATAGAARLVAALSEASPSIQRAGVELAGLAAAGAALKGFDVLKGGFGLSGAATQLEAAATQLEIASGRLMVAAGEEGLGGAVGNLGKKGGLAGLLGAGLEGATISVGTLAIGAIGVAAIVDALSHGPGSKKSLASDRSDFGDPFATSSNPLTGPVDKNGKPVVFGTPRGSVQSKRKGAGLGQWVTGRGGVPEWVEADTQPRIPPMFLKGYLDNPYDPNNPGLYGGFSAGIWPRQPRANPFTAGTAPPLQPEVTREPLGPALPPPTMLPTIDVPAPGAGAQSSHLDELKSKAASAKAELDGLNTTVSPSISMAALDAFLAKIAQAKAELASLGGVGSKAGAARPGPSLASRQTAQYTHAGSNFG